ncbi:MAG: biotin transporter BioY [Oscillatoriales cyanobacterium RM1_1_9]|nr:biotin transporter BioY [Oscillatoriales cyanobacterium SM2_3_0]NJO44565.1 biotin transporter BioY [Oscillatoriales cyanobacterium RM2_1_1]NJO71223.1 biotin transporter BioY [Oscillatoriales cyanobacterium RM1_1_9]
MTPPFELLWAIIGVLLTIGGTFLPAFVADPIWFWQQRGVQVYSLGVTFQIGAVLFVGCMGGKSAAIISQIAYLAMGLTFFPVFSEGGGLDYLNQPTFGYLLGFIPGGWVCGFLALKSPPKLELLSWSCLWGLGAIHTVGIAYLIFGYFNSIFDLTITLGEAIYQYSLAPLPGQFGVVCAIAVLSYILRGLMLY